MNNLVGNWQTPTDQISFETAHQVYGTTACHIFSSDDSEPCKRVILGGGKYKVDETTPDFVFLTLDYEHFNRGFIKERFRIINENVDSSTNELQVWNESTKRYETWKRILFKNGVKISG